MVGQIPSFILFGLSLTLLSFPVECQEVFTLTVSPEQSMAGLCPQRITFTCTTRNVTMLGTAIRWYFNNDRTVQNEFVFVRGQTYPHTIMGNTFTVEVESADLTSDSSSINAIVTLQINASTLVAMGITSVQCGRTLDTRIREVNVSSQLDNMEVPSLSQLNLSVTYTDKNATYTDNRLLSVNVSGQQFYNLRNCEYKQNTAINNITSQVGDTVISCDVMSVSCGYPPLPNSTDATVQITATNSLGLSNSRNYSIPTVSFINMSIAFNGLSCNIRIECQNVSSQSHLDGCELFNSTSDSYDDMMLITTTSGYAMLNVTGDKMYFFSAIYKDEVTTILQRTFTTESCANNGATKSSNTTTHIIIGIVVPVGIILLVIVAVLVGLIIFYTKRREFVELDSKEPQKGEMELPKKINEEEFAETDENYAAGLTNPESNQSGNDFTSSTAVSSS